MKEKPKIGTVGTQTFAVESRHVIDFSDETLPPVLATPFLIGFLERTARFTLQPFLEPGETSLGVEIELTHLAPTPLGDSVTCQARVVHCDGSRVSFQIEARDAQEIIARGFHKRAVVRKDGFARRVARKRR